MAYCQGVYGPQATINLSLNRITTACALILGPILPRSRTCEAPAQHAAEAAYLPLSLGSLDAVADLLVHREAWL
jgi:hypothetical protein